jgi:cyclophilin family peptidyl-prolyl cis-trans isomerase
MSKSFPPSIALLGAVFLMAGCSSDAEEGAVNTSEAAGNSPAPAEVTPAPAEDPPAAVGNTTEPADGPIAAIQAFIESEGVDTTSAGWRTRLRIPPRQTFPDKAYYWNLNTSEGPIKLKFMPDVAPMHVTSTIYLTELGYFDGLTFHRVIPGFMAQGGCPLGTGTGSPGYSYGGEFSPQVRHDRGGLLSMANSGPGTDGSQFFLTFGAARHLDDKHTIFAEVVEGTETLRKLEAAGSPGAGRPTKPLTIDKATITVE